jgi:hypothetical protein
MAFNYDVCYTDKHVVSLLNSIALNWERHPAEVDGLDVGELHSAIKTIVNEWRKKGSSEAVDKHLQALLALAVATTWFSEEQNGKLEGWLKEVASCCSNEDWITTFDDEVALHEVIKKKYQPREITKITVDKDNNSIAVDYKGGDSGRGTHDGKLLLNDDGLYLYDLGEVGKYRLFQGDFPSTLEELDKCLQSEVWIVLDSTVTCVSESDWMKAFDERRLAEVINKVFRPREIAKIAIYEDANCITVDYKDGDSGTGKHDGHLYLGDEGLYLYDLREPGKYREFEDELPSTLEHLVGCLQSDLWSTHWEEDAEDNGMDVGYAGA